MQKFRINTTIQLYWKQWKDEEECILFNVASGQTHLLNPLGVLVLQVLKHSSLDCDQLIEYLVDKFDNPMSILELKPSISNILSQFEVLGIIEPFFQ